MEKRNFSYDYGRWIWHDWDSTNTKAGFTFDYSHLYNYLYPDHELKFLLFDGSNYTLYTPDSDLGGEYISFIWQDSDIGWISHYEETPTSPYNQELRYVMVDDS